MAIWVRGSALVLGLAVTAAALPARADILGLLVNEVMGSIVRGPGGAPRPPLPDDRRPIPDDAMAGLMAPPRGRLVEIDGQSRRLAPGCQIRDRHNRIVQPGRVRARARVRYTLDRRGEVRRVWLMGAG